MTKRATQERAFFVDVTDTDTRAPLLPELIEQFTQHGYHPLGRFGGLDPPAPPRSALPRKDQAKLASWGLRPALALLAASDGSAFASVDTYGTAPVVRLRTELDDRSLVETIGVTSDGVLKARRTIDPLLPFKQLDAPGRSVRLTTSLTAKALTAEHAAHVQFVVASTASPPRRACNRTDALRLWNTAASHARVSAHRWAHFSALTYAAIIPTILLANTIGLALLAALPVQRSTQALAIGIVVTTPLCIMTMLRARAFQRRALRHGSWHRPHYPRS